MSCKSLLLAFAFICSIYAAASYVTDFEADFAVSALLAVLCLGVVFALDHREAELRHAAEWREIWAAFDDDYEEWDA